jgi:hypothetical protein
LSAPHHLYLQDNFTLALITLCHSSNISPYMLHGPPVPSFFIVIILITFYDEYDNHPLVKCKFICRCCTDYQRKNISIM